MIDTIEEKEIKNKLNPLDNFSWVLIVLFVSLIISMIKNLAPTNIIASWDIATYILLLLPLFYMIYNKEIANQFTKWIVPFLLILIIDVYYYNNELSQEVLPIIIYICIGILYIGSVQNMEYFFQVIIPKLSGSFRIFGAVGVFIKPILSLKKYQQELIRSTLTIRIGLGLLITLPVMLLFLFLFMKSDPQFSHFITNLFSFVNPFKVYHSFTIPLSFLFVLILFSYAISSTKSRSINLDTNAFDIVVIGIFLGSLNFLFISFLAFQLPYIFGGENYILENGINISNYARKGFFELAIVMGIVVFIFLIIIYRYKNEKIISIMMSGLMFQTMIMGYSSLKKMYLYQSMKGATVLRYYVEWFDYFLLLILFLGMIYFLTKKPFYSMLNTVTILSILSFTTIASVNIEGIVAKQNIEQFKSNPEKLDKVMLSYLSVDILPYIQNTDIILDSYRHLYFSKARRNCKNFSEYHIGYCNKIETYGMKKIRVNR